MSSSSIGVVPGAAPKVASEADSVAGAVRRIAPRAGKGLLGASVLSVGVWYFIKRFILFVSTQAVVGANLFTMRAPIDGLLDESAIVRGRLIEARQAIATVDNPLADDKVVRELELQLAGTEVEVNTITPLVQELDTVASGLKTNTQLYQERRIAQLRAASSEVEAKLAAQQAQANEAAERYKRISALSSDGLASSEKRSEAERDAIVGAKSVEALQSNLEGIGAQFGAARMGINVDASGMGSDRPYSGQRFDELRIERARWRQRLDEQQRRRDMLKEHLTRAKARLQEFSQASLITPRRGRIWDVLTAPGTFVSRGAPVVSMIDCENLLVVAAVSERVFNHLTTSSVARFTVRETGRQFEGKVVQLLGPSESLPGLITAPGLLNAPDGASAGDTHRVILSFPGLSAGSAEDCSIGRSGEVSFH